MSASLSGRRALDDATLWSAMQRLVDRAFGVLRAGDGGAAVEQGLDVLVDVLGADRGMLLVVQSDGTSRVFKARTPHGPLDALEHEEISRTVVRRALDTGDVVAWDPMSSSGASSSVSTLGIVASLASPLRVGGETRGVLYVDFRARDRHVGERHIEFFRAAAPLLGSLLVTAAHLKSTREELQELRSRRIDASETPSLEQLLAAPSLGAIHRELQSGVNGATPILILGESGTGKTLLAQAIAEASARRPIVRAVLGSSDDLNTITSELFGHERGSFSGATARRVGLVEFAKGGTLILDEVLNLPSHAQRLLLDFTQFGTYRPLGWDRAEPKRADVRIIAATNGDLTRAIAEGRFREDLYYRLAALTVRLPPLRERRSEIPALVDGFLRRIDRARTFHLSLQLRRMLTSDALDWPGNVRQLERMAQRARERALADDATADTLLPIHFDFAAMEGRRVEATRLSSPPPPAEELSERWRSLQGEHARLEVEERETIRAALVKHAGVVAHAARELGVARTTLASRVEALGIARPRKDSPL